MRVDWSSAEVRAATNNQSFVLRVTLTDVGGQAYHDAFAAEAARWRSGPGDERRNVDRYRSRGAWEAGTTGAEWGIEVWPIDPDDIDGERRLLEEFVERVNRAAEPAQAKLDEAARQRKAEAEALEQRAKDLTERFRQQ